MLSCCSFGEDNRVSHRTNNRKLVAISMSNSINDHYASEATPYIKYIQLHQGATSMQQFYFSGLKVQKLKITKIFKTLQILLPVLERKIETYDES